MPRARTAQQALEADIAALDKKIEALGEEIMRYEDVEKTARGKAQDAEDRLATASRHRQASQTALALLQNADILQALSPDEVRETVAEVRDVIADSPEGTKEPDREPAKNEPGMKVRKLSAGVDPVAELMSDRAKDLQEATPVAD